MINKCMTIKFRGPFLANGDVRIYFNAPPITPVDSIYAGDDEMIMCSALVYLTGSVVGGLNNAFLWEQLTGDPVTIIDPTSLTAYFVNTGGSDLTFRLWADKGTPYQDFDDVLITRTPSTWEATVAGNVSSDTAIAYDYTQPNWRYNTPFRDITSVTTGPGITWPPPTDADDGLSCPEISVTDASVTWTLPVDLYPVGSATYIAYFLSQFVQVNVEKFVAGDWVVDQTYVGESASRTAPIDLNELYRLVAVYDYAVMPAHVQITDVFTVIPGTQLYKKPWTNERTVAGALVQGAQQVTRITATIKNAPDDESATVAGNVVQGNDTVKRLTGETMSAPDDEETTVAGNVVQGPWTVDRNFGNNIGG